MISTVDLRAWLKDALLSIPDLKHVGLHSQADLEKALMHFRDAHQHIAIVMPGPDEIAHQTEPGITEPILSTASSVFDILFAGRRLDRSPEGDTATLDLKDAILDMFLSVAVPDQEAHCLVTLSEPVTVQLDDNQGRDAWKVTLTIHPVIP